MMRKFSLFLLTLSAATTTLAESKINMPQGVTEVSREIYDLHMLIFLVCCAIAVFVFGWMIVALVLHRKSRGVEPAKFSHSTKAEFIWTIIPIGILIGMAIPSAETLVKIEDSRNPDITVKVTGYQWKWHYEYLDENVEFYSNLARTSNEARRLGSGIEPASVPNYLLEVDNPMVVPAGAKVRLLITSNDVIHAWWMKDFGIKKDAIPGFINEAWFRADEPGVYRGQCSELCGKDHGFMPIVVEVLDQPEYEGWVAARQAEQDDSPRVAAATD